MFQVPEINLAAVNFHSAFLRRHHIMKFAATVIAIFLRHVQVPGRNGGDLYGALHRRNNWVCHGIRISSYAK